MGISFGPIFFFFMVLQYMGHRKNIQLFRVRAEAKQIRVVSEELAGMLVYADKEMLELTIRNLLSNTIKFTDVGGSIRLKAERLEGSIIISIIRRRNLV